MKKYIFTVTALLAVSAGFAQPAVNARNILDKAYSAYENSNGIKMAFNITSTDENGTVYQSQKGTARVKGNKFKIETSTIDTWFDGKTQWVLMKELNEVNISHPSNEEVASNSPLALLSMYKTGFTLDAPASEIINGKNAFVINLSPTGSKSDFKEISVAIEKKNNSVLQVDITLKNGMRNKIDIGDYNTNYNFADTEFIFNKDHHKGVEVVDLR